MAADELRERPVQVERVGEVVHVVLELHDGVDQLGAVCVPVPDGQEVLAIKFQIQVKETSEEIGNVSEL